MTLNKKLSELFGLREREPKRLFDEMDKMGKLDDKKIHEILLTIIDDLNELHKNLD